MGTMPGDVERGRREVLVLAVLCAVTVLLLTLQAWRVSSHFPGWLYPGALLAMIALGLLTYARWRWARALLVLLAGLTSASVTMAAMQAFYYSRVAAVALLMVAALLAGAAWRLQTSRHINAFLGI